MIQQYCDALVLVLDTLGKASARSPSDKWKFSESYNLRSSAAIDFLFHKVSAAQCLLHSPSLKHFACECDLSADQATCDQGFKKHLSDMTEVRTQTWAA